MKKKIILSMLTVLFIAILAFRPIGSIEGFFDFKKDEDIQIQFIKTSNTSVIRFLDEEEANEIYEELIKLKYFFRFQRDEYYPVWGDNVHVGREEYGFKMFKSDKEPFGITINENILMIGTKTRIHTFWLLSSDEIHELLDELYDRDS